MSDTEIKNLSSVKVGDYLREFIEDKEIEKPNIKPLKHAFSNYKSQFYAIIATLGYICKDVDFYKEAFWETNAFKNDKVSLDISCVYMDIYFEHNIEGICRRPIRNHCFKNENKNKNEYQYANFRIPQNTGKDNVKRFSIVTGDIEPNSTLKEFFDQIWGWVKADRKDKMKEFIKEAFGINMDDNLIKNQLERKIENGIKQIVLHGAPGTGKTYTAETVAENFVKKQCEDENKTFGKEIRKKHIRLVQFHPSFNYTDFVEGLRPISLKDDQDPTFVRMDGELKKFCREIVEENNNNASNDKEKYFLIIDEINRADLSEVLGDLMYCMNDSQRTSKKDGEPRIVKTPYNNMPTYDSSKGKFLSLSTVNTDNDYDVFRDGFYLPDNLYIIGTMNDIDRSVESFDFALRRRFDWIEADANTEAEEALKKENMFKDNDNISDDNLGLLYNRLKDLNDIIAKPNETKSDTLTQGEELGLSKDYHIGHAYLKNYDGTEESLNRIWKNNVEPILKEYCRNQNKEKAKKFIEACEKTFIEGKTSSKN